MHVLLKDQCLRYRQVYERFSHRLADKDAFVMRQTRLEELRDFFQIWTFVVQINIKQSIADDAQ